jgi:hypothetical protein
MPWVKKEFLETFDQVLNISATQKVSARFAEGALCHEEGFFEAGILAPLFLDPAVAKIGAADCGKTISATSAYGTLDFCLGDDGAPRQLNVSLKGAKVGSTNVGQYWTIATFVNVSLAPLPAEAFFLPSSCVEGAPPAACALPQGEAMEETITVTHWNHAAGKSCGLNNQMTNDLMGMLAFAPMLSTANFFEYLQVYTVSVRRGFAPMQDCNYDPIQKARVCTGGHRTAQNAKSVGRSSCQYMTGPYGGQCAENAVTGSWYQFPTEGECAPGWDIGFSGCTWKTKSFKVVASKCITDRCGASSQQEESPYLRTRQCLELAIAECPDQRGPPSPTCFSRPAAVPEPLV